jgi:predicted DNA-binding protein
MTRFTRKNMTLRLPAEQAAELEAVARAEGISVSDAVREAITEHIERKRKDKAFRERLRAVMDRDREILDRLGTLTVGGASRSRRLPADRGSRARRSTLRQRASRAWTSSTRLPCSAYLAMLEFLAWNQVEGAAVGSRRTS